MNRRMQGTSLSGSIAGAFIVMAILAAVAPLTASAQGAPKTGVGAGADWDKVLGAAKKEGKVVLYTATVVPVMQRIKEDFDKAYPDITLEWVRYTSGPLMIKVDQERRAGVTGADVVSSTEVGWFEDRAKESAIVRAIGPDAARFPERHLIAGIVPVLSMEAIVMMVNTNIVKTPVNSHMDVLRPEFKGRIGMEDLLSTTVVGFYTWLEQNHGAGYLDRLAAQQPRLYTSTVGGGQSLAAGEIAIATYINTGAAVPLVKTGAPVKIVYPNPGFGNAYVGAIVNWAGHPNAAQVLMNYMMSARGQAVWNGNGDSASPLPNIPNSLDANTLQRVDLSKFPPEVVKPFTARWNKLFK